jgi:hypothetical protein
MILVSYWQRPMIPTKVKFLKYCLVFLGYCLVLLGIVKILSGSARYCLVLHGISQTVEKETMTQINPFINFFKFSIA